MKLEPPKIPQPEFGNPEHIRLIRSYEKAVEEAEKTDEYEVELRIECSGRVAKTVRAHNEEEAVEMAKEEWDMDDLGDSEVVVGEIRKRSKK